MASRPRKTPDPGLEQRPEHWEDDAADGDVARLTIPGDLQRDRTFEVFCSLTVDAGGRDAAWLAMRVLVDGAQEWQRREPVHGSGRDSLDYRFRRVVAAGQPLRVQATTEVHGARRIRLRITADED